MKTKLAIFTAALALSVGEVVAQPEMNYDQYRLYLQQQEQQGKPAGREQLDCLRQLLEIKALDQKIYRLEHPIRQRTLEDTIVDAILTAQFLTERP